MSESVNNKIVSATKWSAATEIVARLLLPIVNMVLARVLTPEAFGVVATLTMIISFAEIFTDAGFQNYLIQHEFVDAIDREESTCVAFWSNLVMSLLIWGIIIVFAEPLAALVGNSGLGVVLIVACASIPLTGLSSIQMALYKRDLDFKMLFKIRLVGILVPLLVTIPLAIWMRSYWALVIGTIAQNLINALLLTFFSGWKPKFYYSLDKLREMLSFTAWSVVEAVTMWLTGYIDVFIVGTMLSQYYLGLYKTSITLVGQIMGLVTITTTPILFASLSRLQSDVDGFKDLFFRFQKIVGLMVIPMGFGMFCFSDLVTELFLGSQWMDASGFIGLWALTSSVTIVFWHFCSEVYRAKGLPKLSTLAQILHIIFLWPTVIIAVDYGFETLYVSRSLVRFQGILVHMLLMYYVVRISPWKMIKNVAPSLAASTIMLVVALHMLRLSHEMWWQLLSILICAVVYGSIVIIFPKERNILRRYVLNRNIHEGISSR